jgi:hypothetical protein
LQHAIRHRNKAAFSPGNFAPIITVTKMGEVFVFISDSAQVVQNGKFYVKQEVVESVYEPDVTNL